MKKAIILFLLLGFAAAFAQTKDSVGLPISPSPYRAAVTKVNDLVHTKLDVRFDYDKSWMYGRAWVTLHPHFYATDSVSLDAKGMAIEEVSLSSAGKSIPLKYYYDSMNLHITLNKIYKSTENYTIYIKYIAKPDGYKASIYSMMPGEKGLYFINPLGDIKGKPTQIWTQGETEANSYWFPTIDKPNQKTTDEISMTVPAKYVTLSNGLMASQKLNADGTRTDTWKMGLPHAPYLIFMCVGEYAIIKDKYKNKEVSYYVEREYAPYARQIFGHTPEMIAFFSRITGVDFPWPKYAQITGRDYIFGAMENTSATLHEENSQQDARQLVDGNGWENIIAHELFHQWFGDYVTTESWSNTTVNESFADYSETLWNDYKYGKEAGQAVTYSDLRTYTGNPDNEAKNLVSFHYDNVVEMFDGVSYQKGGGILNMLRNYVGDSAFFKSLNNYLTTNKFKSGEAQNLRLAFEEVTGQDMNWFFNQWYYNHGHPKLDITYGYDAAAKTAKVFIQQTQAGTIFKLPFAIDVYEGNNKKRYKVWMNNAADTFSFTANTAPTLINVDAEKILVCEKADHKTAANFIAQYKFAASYIDRREAIAYFLSHMQEPQAIPFLQAALKDKNDNLRRVLLQHLDMENDTVRQSMEPILLNLINDKKALVRADAIACLGAYKKPAYKTLFVKTISDPSYTIAGKGLEALAKVDSVMAFDKAKTLSAQTAKGKLQDVILTLFGKYGGENEYNYIYGQFKKAGINDRFNILGPITDALSKENNNTIVKEQITLIAKFRDELPAFIRHYVDPMINGSLSTVAASKKAAGNTELSTYINSIVPTAGVKNK